MKWHIWDFPDSIYVKFSASYRIKLYRYLIKKFGSRAKAAKNLGIHTTSLRDNLQRAHDSEGLEVYTSVRIVKKLIHLFPNIKNRIEKNIIAYRSLSGNSVYNPILPIRESSEIYSIVAHMICDGSAGKRKTPAYYNTSDKLREELKSYLQIFGEVKTNEYLVQSNVYAVLFPKAITDILSHIFQTTFVRTKKLPIVVFEASKESRCAFIRGMFDDEGSISKGGQLTFVQKEIQIVKDLKKLLNGLDIKTGKIHIDKKNCSVITVLSESRELFSDLISFTHPEKSVRLKESVKADKIRKSHKQLIDKVDELFLTENGLTRYQISKKLNANINSITQILYILRKEGKLKSRFSGKNKPYLWTRAYGE